MTIHQTLSLLVSFEYILLITGGGPFYDTTVFSLYAYRRAFENGQYAYGAALSLILIVIGVIAALAMWRLMDMRRLLQTAADRGALMPAQTLSRGVHGRRRSSTGSRSAQARAVRARIAGQVGAARVPADRVGPDHPAVFLDGGDLVHRAHRRRVDAACCGPRARSSCPRSLLYCVVHAMTASPRVRHGRRGRSCSRPRPRCSPRSSAIACMLANYRFLWNPNIVEEIRSKATAGSQFPSVWIAFRNSLALALSQTAIILTVASLAGYYISRFAFRGREAFLQGMLVLHAFPAMTLIIPIFLILHWVGLLDTIAGVMLVLATIELPFYVFVMKGFFDAVPWDIEMSAMTDGATRRQAFRLVVLPQVRVGLIAVAVFAFIRAWEEYIFVRTMLIENTQLGDEPVSVLGRRTTSWASTTASSPPCRCSTSLPSLLLYVFCQKYLTQMTIGGIRG